VEEAVGEQLLQVGFHCPFGQQLAVDAPGVQLGHLVDLDAGGVLHGQHLRGGLLPEDAGHPDPRSLPKVLAEPISILPLQLVIDFLNAQNAVSSSVAWKTTSVTSVQKSRGICARLTAANEWRSLPSKL
jgi:hypothetical protein